VVNSTNCNKKLIEQFSKNALLWGTFSDKLSVKNSDEFNEYFNKFSKFPNLEVINKEYNISKITDDVYVNNAYIQWKWLYRSSTTFRMTFIYKLEDLDYKIHQLHSSILPSLFSFRCPSNSPEW